MGVFSRSTDKNFAKGKLQIRGQPQSPLFTFVPQNFPTKRIGKVYWAKNDCFATKGALGGQSPQSSIIPSELQEVTL